MSLFVPPHFKEDDLGVLRAAIAGRALGTLVTIGTGGLEASHVPMLLDPEPGPLGTLRGHVSRSNPQWHRAAREHDALAIFLGPDAYISPAWYPTKRESGKVVPTWNYVAIHAAGRVSFYDDPDRLLALVTKLTETHEAGRPTPWAVSDAPDDFIRRMLGGIVGFELTIARLEGKWKMSQNRPAEDRAGVVQGLQREGGPAAAEVARIVEERSR